jgi:hypothetical protein
MCLSMGAEQITERPNNDSFEDLAGPAAVCRSSILIRAALEKTAARGELMTEEREVPLRTQLEGFEEIVFKISKSLGGRDDV